MSLPLVSIVVPTYNRDRYLRGALTSLLEQETDGKFDFEVVVVDNGSTDNTLGEVNTIANESPVPVRYVMEQREGVAQARNAGIRAALGEWLAFFDDDQIATTHWLKHLFEAAETTQAKCFGGAVHLDLPEDELQQLSVAYRETILRERSDESSVGEVRPYCGNQYPGTGNLLLARSVFDHIGMFDETLVLGGEDHDLAIRIRRAGYDMWYIPGAIIRHRVFPKRLTPEFMRWDAVQGGAEAAFFDHRYRGGAIAIILCFARICKSTIITFPKLIYAKVVGNSSVDLACQIKLRRQEGYIRGLVTLLLPSVFPEDSLTRRWAFRKGREIELS